MSGYSNATKVAEISMAVSNDWQLNNATYAFIGAVLFGSSQNWYAYQQAGIDAAKAAAESSEEATVEEVIVTDETTTDATAEGDQAAAAEETAATL